MKIMEFISNENLKKKNPFEDCQIIERVDTETYQNIINSAMVIAFNLDTNEPRTMFYDFAVRFSILGNVLNLDISEYDIDEVFSVIMTTDIYDRFVIYMDQENGINVYMIEKAVYHYIDEETENSRIMKSTDERIMNTMIRLFENKAFQDLIEQYANVSDTEEVEVNG